MKSLLKFVPELVCACVIASLAVLVVMCDRATAESIPISTVNVCIEQPDGSRDVWTFGSHEKVTPIPSPALARSVQNALRNQARVRNSPDLMLRAESVRFTADYARLPNKPKIAWEDPGSGYSCVCAVATYTSKGKLSGCMASGCETCYLCTAQ